MAGLLRPLRLYSTRLTLLVSSDDSLLVVMSLRVKQFWFYVLL